MDRTRGWAGKCSLLIVTAAVTVPTLASAQDGGEGFLFKTPRFTVGLKLGYAQPSANSDLFDFTTEQLTLDRSDLGAPVVAGEVAIRSTDRIDATIYFGHASGSKGSEFRDWVDNNDRPIEQVSKFARTTLTGGARFYLTPRDRTIGRFAWVPSKWAPYVGVSGGWMWYSFEQQGDFVDFETLDVFTETFTTSGTSFTGQIAAGLDLSLSPRIVLNSEGRYSWGRAEAAGDFLGFDPVDLSGFQLTFGIGARL